MLRSAINLYLSFLITVFFTSNLFAEVTAVQKDAVFFTNKVTSTTSEPSTLQYYEFRENIADEISIDVYTDKDFSNLDGKKIFVGYGVVDPTGDDCKVFTPDITGQDNNITICLPWWRIEREYFVSSDQGSGDSFASFISRMQRPRPPKNVSVCDAWDSSQELPGGTVTCTTYYDRAISDECLANPLQAKCKKDNCGSWVKENCTLTGHSLGHEKQSLENVELGLTAEKKYESKVHLVTDQFICPGGSFTNSAVCIDEKEVVMSPYECKPDDTSTPLDDSIMIYCDEDKPVRDVASGSITGFLGTCPAEASSTNVSFEVTCQVNSFTQTKNTCTDYGETLTNTTDTILEQSYDLQYTIQKVHVLSGAVDKFANREDCVRANTATESKPDSAYMHVTGSGSLDDDFYLIIHHNDDTHNVEYCNQQHTPGSILNMPALGPPVSCVTNAGNYSFDKNVNIHTSDIVSAQEVNEHLDRGSSFFYGRNDAVATEVTIDGSTAITEVFGHSFPNYVYQSEGDRIDIWNNVEYSLAIMFPYVGSYMLYFYTDGGDFVTSRYIGLDDFKTLNSGDGFKQLFLAKDIEIAPTLDANNEDTLCLKDDWTEYGGGVHGGKGSILGENCQEPSAGNSYQKNKAIRRVVVKDLLTNSFTVIPLVYPLAYPNRVFVSKVKLYEDRVYHCYEQPEISVPLGSN